MRAERILLPLLLLAACASEPRPAEPPQLKAALEAEADGAKRYQHGDHVVAQRRFREAERLFLSIDDAAGRARNLRHLSRVALAQGKAGDALELLESDTAEPQSVETRLLRGQALLASGRRDEAARVLGDLAAGCAAPCPQAVSLGILRGRVALASGDDHAARGHAESVLALIKDRDEPIESGNAWRLLGAARLAGGDAAGALAAARSALDIDRRLAIPEKIAHDWLLIGDIHAKAIAHPASASEAVAAYRRAGDVAAAAGLDAITMSAKQALQAIGMQKN